VLAGLPPWSWAELIGHSLGLGPLSEMGRHGLEATGLGLVLVQRHFNPFPFHLFV
jgi:hypothetical protein